MQLTSIRAWAACVSLAALSGGPGWFHPTSARRAAPRPDARDATAMQTEGPELVPFWSFERRGSTLGAALVGPRSDRGLHVGLIRFDPEASAPLVSGAGRVLLETAHPFEVAIGEQGVGVAPATGLLWADVESAEQLVLTIRDGEER